MKDEVVRTVAGGGVAEATIEGEAGGLGRKADLVVRWGDQSESWGSARVCSGKKYLI